MIVVGHQPEFMPYLGFFSKILKGDVFVIVDNIQYRKKYFQNRNKIKTPSGGTWLTIPVLTKNNFVQNINEVQINNNTSWRKKHLKTIYYNYKDAPFFDDYYDFFKDMYSQEWEYLCEFNIKLIKFLLDEFDIHPKKIYRGSELGIGGNKTDLILDICKKTGADTYIFGVGGKDYVDESKFSKEGLNYKIFEFKHPTYPQIHGEFIPYLSSIDLLFNCGPDSKKYLIQNP